MSHERCAGSMSHELVGVEACRPLPAILQAGLAQHTGAAFVSTSARACACGSAMEARRRALQRSGCSDTSTQLLATTSLFCCGVVTYDAGPARTGVAASRIGDARCCDGCAQCRVGSAAGCCPHAKLEIWPAGPRCAAPAGGSAGARALGSNLAGNAVSQHRLCVIDVITSIHTACRQHETRHEGRVPTERPLKAQAHVPPRRALRGSQR